MVVAVIPGSKAHGDSGQEDARRREAPKAARREQKKGASTALPTKYGTTKFAYVRNGVR